MTETDTTDDRFDVLDDDHIAQAAAWAAEQLVLHGVARLSLTPGDMTEYRLLIAAPDVEWAYGDERPGRNYIVALCSSFGAGYPWNGRPVSPGYAAEQWTHRAAGDGVREWTGEVMSRFLTATHQAMVDQAIETAGP